MILGKVGTARGFVATGNKGFHLKFENGWTISVQWGPGNYCLRRMAKPLNAPMLTDESWESTTAEVAIWHTASDRDYLSDPEGWLTPTEVAEWITKVASWT